MIDAAPMRIAFVMPAYNEELLLEESVDAAAPLCETLVIVDDGSRDRTGEIAERMREKYPGVVEVIRHPANRGVGAAILTGVRALVDREDVDAIGITASDNQCDPALIPLFRKVLEEHPDLDLVKGSRFLHPETLHEMPRFRYWGNRTISAAMRLILGYSYLSDALHCYLLARRSAFHAMDFDRIAEGYDVENTMLAEFRRLGCGVGWVPSPSRYGREVSKIVMRTQVPLTLAKMGRLLLSRLGEGTVADRVPPALLLVSVASVTVGVVSAQPALIAGGAAAGVACYVVIKVTSPPVRVFPG
jgi:glycosyltransferase involved in cell wall biosynthesis